MIAEFEASEVFEKTCLADTRIIVHEGSSRSTKTWSIIQYIISQHLDHQELKTTVGRKKLTWLKATVIPDFITVLKTQFALWNQDSWNKSESIFTINGGEVAFIGLDDPQKFHGRKQDILWINEAVEATYKSFTQLLLRTTKKAILDYNPSYESHWIYDKVIPRDDCTFIKSTYKDNPFLEQAIIDEIERLEPTPYNIAQGTADDVLWKIYGLGERAAHRGLIFNDAKIVPAMPDISTWKKSFYGLDFGFTNDPTALIHIVEAHGELWLQQKIYKRGLTNIINPENTKQDSIQRHLQKLGIPKEAEIWADSAEPKSIQDLKNCGYNIKGTDKGPDSVKNGIDTMKRYKINIVEDSVDLIKEKNNYKWSEDSEGNPTNIPVDAFNHGWDGARYGIFMNYRDSTGSFKDLMSALNKNKHQGAEDE